MTETPVVRDLELYEQAYRDHPFEEVQARYRKRLLIDLLERLKPRHVLDVGCGLDTLANHWRGAERFVVVEPTAGFAEKARRDTTGRDDVVVVEATLEDAVDRLDGPFDLIMLSGLLHELPDTAPVLDATRQLCGPETIVHVSVPNTRSFHRLLAVEMGLIDRADDLSDMQRRLQQNRTFTLAELNARLAGHGFASFEEGSYFVKPFTHAQMLQLIDTGLMTPQMLDGLWGMARHMPDLGSEIFVNARLVERGDA